MLEIIFEMVESALAITGLKAKFQSQRRKQLVGAPNEFIFILEPILMKLVAFCVECRPFLKT
jgi:hypothetical protein